MENENLTLVLKPTNKFFNVGLGTLKLLPSKNTKGEEVWIDPDIKNCLGGITVKGRKKEVVSSLQKLSKRRRCRRYNALDALELAKKLIEIDAKEEKISPGTRVVILLQGCKFYNFIAVGRGFFGELGVFIFKGRPERMSELIIGVLS